MPEQYFIIQLYNCYCHRYDTPEDECFDIHDDNVETIRDIYDKEIEELQKRLQVRDLRRWYFEKKKDTEYLLMWCKEEREARIWLEQAEFKQHWPNSRRLPGQYPGVPRIEVTPASEGSQR